jgi:hypothetical protein
LITKFRITFKQQLVVLFRAIIIYFLLGSLIYIRGGNSFNTETKETLLYAAIVIFISDTLPAVILHIQYYFRNKHLELELNGRAETFVLKFKGEEIINESFVNISCFQYYQSYLFMNGRYSFGEYSFVRFIFKNKKEAVITCLMVDDIRSTLELIIKMKAVKESRLACFLPPIAQFLEC